MFVYNFVVLIYVHFYFILSPNCQLLYESGDTFAPTAPTIVADTPQQHKYIYGIVPNLKRFIRRIVYSKN